MMGLDVLGLGIVEHRIYEHLVRHRALSAADLAIELGLRDAQVGSAIDALTTRGLVAREGPAPGRLIAAPPDVALGGLILDHEDRLRQAQAEMLALEQLYRNAGTGEADVVDIVRGSEAVGHRFNQLQRSARSEVLLFVKGDIVAIDREQNVEEELAHQRGIRYRYVLERARLEAPGMLDAVRGAIEGGLDVRVAGSLPTRMLIVDRTIAMVPSAADGEDQSSGALLLHAGGLVGLALSLFERTWQASSHLITRDTGDVEEVDLDAEEREVLALMDAGLTDRAIGLRMGSSVRTVQRRVRELMDRADVDTRLQLGVAAVRRGWL
ncbi:transcriptional regulator TrmB [Microbacterium esteraromaticum]|uniref:helix-turn-helix domain-containing protein n=1 Tax=Microbacterium esteraromaticum TaxID=57043 RepID=UPI001CD7F94A|nr:helix-turn-helix domain-containing protein [Microbacterium esteraromaticum]MCA1305814.1 transcriptional regulator TrmB [Microbacterium esteraromaticum]